MEQKYARVAEENSWWQKQAEEAEEEARRLKMEIISANSIIDNLQQKLQDSAQMLEIFKSLNASTVQGIEDIFKSLEKVRSGLSI